MITKIKKLLYFPVAAYFRFFAAIRLRRWNPQVVVVTGSNGKTTLLHMLEAQIGDKAFYSYHANSSFGLPFSILGLERKTLIKTEWISLFLLAPFRVFSPIPKESIFVAEADCDRPGEGKFLAEFLKPEVVLWVSTSRTHSMNFDRLVCLHPRGGVRRQAHLGGGECFATVEEAIAYEFGHFLEYCSKLVVIDGDSSLQKGQIYRTKAGVKLIKKQESVKKYSVGKDGTKFQIKNETFSFPFLLPEEVFYAIAMCREAVNYFNLPFDSKFSRFSLPPGRGSVFAGIKETTIIDSCYNANLSSMTATIKMYQQFPAKEKWAVIGDMLEQGKGEREEHEKLAEIIANSDFARIVFLGPRVLKYTFPKLKKLTNEKTPIDAFENPKEVLDFLKNHIAGEETILFKGARFMEGIIENLLEDKKDVAKLSRREKIWNIRRKKWGL